MQDLLHHRLVGAKGAGCTRHADEHHVAPVAGGERIVAQQLAVAVARAEDGQNQDVLVAQPGGLQDAGHLVGFHAVEN